MEGNTGMTPNSSTNEEEIEDQVQGGWKSKLSAWGLSAVGCAVRFRSRFVFPENILSICARNSPKIDTSGIAILRRKNKPEGGI